jgi:glycosyltransferase involved in cell wall biosynthesis
VQLLGAYQGDVDALLASFDAYVFPSYWEGFPYSILEALRAGCAIVATRVGGIPEAISNGHDGILIEPRSATAIVDAIEYLLANPDARQTLSANARERYERDFSLHGMHQRMRGALSPVRSAGGAIRVAL